MLSSPGREQQLWERSHEKMDHHSLSSSSGSIPGSVGNMSTPPKLFVINESGTQGVVKIAKRSRQTRTNCDESSLQELDERVASADMKHSAVDNKKDSSLSPTSITHDFSQHGECSQQQALNPIPVELRSTGSHKSSQSKRSRRSTKSNSRRKRGNSLEREISRLILTRAIEEEEKKTEFPELVESDSCSVHFILTDLQDEASKAQGDAKAHYPFDETKYCTDELESQIDKSSIATASESSLSDKMATSVVDTTGETMAETTFDSEPSKERIKELMAEQLLLSTGESALPHDDLFDGLDQLSASFDIDVIQEETSLEARSTPISQKHGAIDSGINQNDTLNTEGTPFSLDDSLLNYSSSKCTSEFPTPQETTEEILGERIPTPPPPPERAEWEDGPVPAEEVLFSDFLEPAESWTSFEGSHHFQHIEFPMVTPAKVHAIPLCQKDTIPTSRKFAESTRPMRAKDRDEISMIRSEDSWASLEGNVNTKASF